MARTHKRARLQAARERVKKALVERAAAVETQCKVIVEAMAVLRKLQEEVKEEAGSDYDDDDELEFVPERVFESMEDAVLNIRKSIEEKGEPSAAAV